MYSTSCHPDLRAHLEEGFPLLKINKRAEDICELCWQFSNRHRFLAKHPGNSTSDINTSEDHLLFQEDTAVNEMENDPETEELYAVDKAPVDTANGTVDDGTAGATKTEEVDAVDAVPADIANATNVAAVDGVEAFTEAVTAEDDQTEDISSLDLEERCEAM